MSKQAWKSSGAFKILPRVIHNRTMHGILQPWAVLGNPNPLVSFQHCCGCILILSLGQVGGHDGKSDCPVYAESRARLWQCYKNEMQDGCLWKYNDSHWINDWWPLHGKQYDVTRHVHHIPYEMSKVDSFGPSICMMYGNVWYIDQLWSAYIVII